MTNKQANTRGSRIEGEGSYSGARQYNEATKKFVEEGRVEDAARKAQPRNAEEARKMKQAEEAGKRHAKGEDPALNSGGVPESSGES